jgi:hypothetical protein
MLSFKKFFENDGNMPNTHASVNLKSKNIFKQEKSLVVVVVVEVVEVVVEVVVVVVEVVEVVVAVVVVVVG